MLAIIAYGMWRSRGRRSLTTYVKGDGNAGWGTIGLSVAATQASAVTFLSIPGQGFESGLGFVQNYFGLPFALIIIAVVFVPIYRKLNVYTAYEYLGRRFINLSYKEADLFSSRSKVTMDGPLASH